jgi:5'-nucleotidase
MVNRGRKLVIGISSSALFDVAEGNSVYESQGVEAYRRYEKEHREEILEYGAPYDFVSECP